MRKKRVYSNENINKDLQDMSSKNIDTIFRELDSSINGLSEVEANSRLNFYGHNEIISQKRNPWYIYLLNSFIDPFILILLVIVFVSYFTDIVFAPSGEKSWITIIIISTMILVSAILKFSQEHKSQITADNLKDLVPTTTAVERETMGKKEINISDVVPGDIIHLAAGDLIPADLRIITCKDLFISQSSLTGESEPVEKFSEINNKDVNKNIADLENIALMGTIVVSGSAIGIVLQTGNQTYFGTIAESLTKDRGQTSFEEGVKSVSFLLIRFMLIMVPIVFLINGLTKKRLAKCLFICYFSSCRLDS